MAEYIEANGNAVPVSSEAPVASGYIPVTNSAPTAYSQEQAQVGADAFRQVNELQEKLGVDLSQASQAQVPVVNSVNEAPPVQQEDPFAKFNTDRGKRMRQEFAEVMGFDPLTAFQAVQQTQVQLKQMDAWRRQAENERSIDTLRGEWGGEFESTWSEVRERFQALPDNMKLALDNLDGARLLAAQIKAERYQSSGVSLPRSSAPSQTQNIRSTGAPSGYVKLSDFLADRVTEQEYLAAYQSGRVIRDV
jgi:uncharacterized protein YpuA (DUF1002 family)